MRPSGVKCWIMGTRFPRRLPSSCFQSLPICRMPSDMNDLELTKACAQALGFPAREAAGLGIDEPARVILYRPNGLWILYEPLIDNAQVMALVKRFEMQLWPEYERKSNGAKLLGWNAYIRGIGTVTSQELNRAIVECAAKMRGAV